MHSFLTFTAIAAATHLSLAAPTPKYLNLMPTPKYLNLMYRANLTLMQLEPSFVNFPTNGRSGAYGWQTSSYSGWTSGFWPGILLKLYNYTLTADPSTAPFWLSQGKQFTAPLAPERFDTGTHDVGFIMYTSYGQLWHLTGDTTARAYLLQTADSLCTRYSPTVGCLRSWNNYKGEPASWFKVIIDNMLNLELLWWAGQESGNATYTAIANSHSRHMMRDIFQPFNPGCVWHLVTYDADSGAILNRSSTPQGLGLDTVWSRGQAWALNGFVIAHRFTKDAAYLAQAEAAADCFLRLLAECCGESTPFHGAPLWDFNATGVAQWVDTSAMMIAAEALVELGWTSQRGPTYLAAAMQLLDAVEKHWLFGEKENDAVLKNGTVTYPLAGVSIIYGDYYYLAANMKMDATPKALREAAAALLSPPPSPPPTQRGNGNIYALSLNGTSNLVNFVAVSLDTYELRAGPPLPGVRTFGQAAAVSADGATFYAGGIVNIAGAGEGAFLMAVSTATGEVAQLFNTSQWPGAKSGSHLMVEEIFPNPKVGCL